MGVSAEFRGEVVPVGGGENGLIDIAQHSQQQAAALGVQLAHHVVQQQQRGGAGGLGHGAYFGQLERQRGAALLPARAKQPQVALVDQEAQVVAMRAVHGGGGENFAGAAARQLAQVGGGHLLHGQRLPVDGSGQPLAQLLIFVLGQAAGVEGGQVLQRQHLAAAAELGMAQVGRLLQLQHKGVAAHDHGRAMLHQPLVPEGKLGIHGRGVGIHAALTQAAQQAVALRHHLLEGRKRPAVGAVDLAQGNVEIAAALARCTAHQADIFRQKEHSAHQAHEVQPAPRRAVDLDLLGKVGAIPARGEDDFQLQGAAGARPTGMAAGLAARVHLPRHAAVGDRLVGRQPIDDLALALRVHGLAGRQEEDSLQEVGLALGVLPLQQREPARKVQFEPLVVTKMGERQVRKMHGQAAGCGPWGGWSGRPPGHRARYPGRRRFSWPYRFRAAAP